MKKIVKLTENDLTKVVKTIINEYFFDDDDVNFEKPNRNEKRTVSSFKKEIMNKLNSGGSDWATNAPDPKLETLIKGIRRVCDKYENM